MPATRCSRPATSPSSARPLARCETLRRLVRRLLGGLPVPSRSLERARRRAPQCVVHGRVLLRRCRWHRAPSVRAADRPPHPGDLGPMARLGPGAHGRRRTPMRCAACARSGSTPDAATTTTSTWAPRPSASELARLGVADDRVRFELFDGTHGGIDWRYPEAIGWLAERLSGLGGHDPVAAGALRHEEGDVRGAQQRLARRRRRGRARRSRPRR